MVHRSSYRFRSDSNFCHGPYGLACRDKHPRGNTVILVSCTCLHLVQEQGGLDPSQLISNRARALPCILELHLVGSSSWALNVNYANAAIFTPGADSAYCGVTH